MADPFAIIKEQKVAGSSKEEPENSVGQFQAGLAGIASGLLKIPEGFVSLGAELMDATGLTTEAAANVEFVFDKINPFEEIAEQRAVGKILEAIVSVGVPAGIGAKIASKLATKALQAKRTGKYVNIRSLNVKKGLEQVKKLNGASRVKRFGAAVVGGAVGETFVGDIENIGTFGDAFKIGPTQLDVEEDVDFKGEKPEDTQKDATRKLLNRVKFGADSVLYFPFTYGLALGIGKVGKFGKDLAFSSSKINKTINQIASYVRPTSNTPTELFLAKNKELAGQASDANFAMEQVKRIDQEVGKMYPTIKKFFNKTLREDQKQAKQIFYKDLKELMFEGDLSKEMGNTAIVKKLQKQMGNAGLNPESQNVVFDAVYNSRKKFVSLLETIREGSTSKVMLPKDIGNMSGLLGDRVKLMLGNTYKIFQNPYVDSLTGFKPTEEAINKVKEILKRHAARNGRDLTEDQLDYRINEILKNATKFTKQIQLPSTKFTNDSIGAITPDVRKNFVQTLSKKNKNGVPETEIIGKGSKAFRALYGEVDDARLSIFNGIGLLSSLAKRTEFIDDILKTNDEALAKGTRSLFYTDKAEAIKNLGAGGLNNIVSLDDALKGMFKDGVLVNRLRGLYTTEDIANSFQTVDNISNFFTGPKTTKFGQFLTDAYKYTVLYPKAYAQLSKTVLSPTTHARNFLSATAFSLANGTLFANPMLIARAMKDASKVLQFGLRSPEGMKEYRKLLEGGVLNTNTQMGDYLNLLKDINLNPEGGFTTNIFNKMLQKLSRITKPFADLYTLEDDAFKAYNYYIEKTRLGDAYTKAGVKKTINEIEQEAMDIVRNTVPNYAYVSDFVKSLRPLPVANFASFPAAISTSSVGIGTRIFKELRHSKPVTGSSMTPMVFEIGKGLVKNDNPLYGIGMKRLVGSASAFGTLGVGIGAGISAIYGTTEEQERALDRWVAPYEIGDKKFITTDIDKKTGKKNFYYQNWSNNNAYDYLESPFRNLLRSVQNGIETEDQLMKGFINGISDAFSKAIDPFVSESIAPESLIDIFVREGVTREGKKLYTDQTPTPDKVRIALKHIGKTIVPFSQAQLSRIYYAAQGKPDPKGNIYEIDKELSGVLGYRAIKIDPIKGLDFKITELNRASSNSTAVFTGGDAKLLSSPTTKEEIIRQFYFANQALFDTQQKMHLDLKAANKFEVEDSELAQVFERRKISSKEYGPLFVGQFRPYIPSESVLQRAKEKTLEFSAADSTYKDPFAEALPVLIEMINTFQGANLSKRFKPKLEDFIKEEKVEPSGFDPYRTELPPQPMPNPQIVTPPMPQVSSTN
ncbi:MAG: hypothetical protein O3C61_06385, partial [Proteobacteria bacterium]|nr:hypothetical protein [Pseudomonadota bacterium]